MVIRGQIDISVILARQALEQVRNGRLGDDSENIAKTIQESYIQLRYARGGLIMKRTQYNPLPQLAYDALQPAAGDLDNGWRKASAVAELRLSEGDLSSYSAAIVQHLENAIVVMQQSQDLL
jgi:hypothetical protein